MVVLSISLSICDTCLIIIVIIIITMSIIIIIMNICDTLLIIIMVKSSMQATQKIKKTGRKKNVIPAKPIRN